MFHSTAFDAHHSIPTTVEITKNANNGVTDKRAFPSSGLNINQIKEAIFAQKLVPNIYTHTEIRKQPDGSLKQGFSKKYLASTCAANLRSGFPVLLIGDYIHGDFNQKHMICAVGFREVEQPSKPPATYSTTDENSEIFYIHDDNIGPNIRFKLQEEEGLAILVTTPPSYLKPDTTSPQQTVAFRPSIMIFAVPDDLRIDADQFAHIGKNNARIISILLAQAYQTSGIEAPAISYNTQFLNVRNYFSKYLPALFEGEAKELGYIRTKLLEKAPPFSLHIGLVSIGLCDKSVSRLIDVIYDTTATNAHPNALTHVIYDPKLKEILDEFPQADVKLLFGTQILGFRPCN